MSGADCLLGSGPFQGGIGVVIAGCEREQRKHHRKKDDEQLQYGFTFHVALLFFSDGTTLLLRPIRHQSDGAHIVLYHAFQSTGPVTTR